jgi:hypothetical protein
MGVGMVGSAGTTTWVFDGTGWTQAGSMTSALTAVSCVTTSMCAVTQGIGDAYTWNGTTWSDPVLVSPNQYASFMDISCPTTTFCVAVDDTNKAYVAS